MAVWSPPVREMHGIESRHEKTRPPYAERIQNNCTKEGVIMTEPSETASESSTPNVAEPRRFDTFIFDLDGTLLDTLPDLVTMTNMSLAHFGWPERTRDEVLSFVGNGAKALMVKAVPAGLPDDQVEAALAYWKGLYAEHGHTLTAPYPHVMDVLAELRRRGCKTAILSNKFDAGVKDVEARYFPGLFDMALGEGPVPRKPDPTGLLHVIAELGADPARVAYFGDSAGDMATARAAGVFAAGVTWGYQPREALVEAGADVLLDSAERILQFA